MAAPARSPIVVDVRAASPDVCTIDLLARLQLGARRQGRSLLLLDASAELVDLIVFVGLGEALSVEAERQAEQREQPLRIEEEGQLDDPPV